MRELLHDGLVVHTKVYYTLDRGKRIYSDTDPLEGDYQEATFEFEAYMYPPLLFLPDTWKRYNYTVEDVKSTYVKMEASYVWQMALLFMTGTYEPESASAGVRSSFQSPFTFSFISRKTVFDMFLSAHSDYVCKNGQPVLCRERPDHKPLLPKVMVDKPTFELAQWLVPAKPCSFLNKVKYEHAFNFKGVWLIPYAYDAQHKLVEMMRVVKKSVYDQLPTKPKHCVITLPFIAEAPLDGPPEEVVIVEEGCFFYCSEVVKSLPAPAKKKNKSRKRTSLEEEKDIMSPKQVKRTRKAKSATQN